MKILPGKHALGDGYLWGGGAGGDYSGTLEEAGHSFY